MAKPGNTRDVDGAVPSQHPQTTPAAYPSFDHSFTLQAVMEMQKALGKLEQAVTTLTEETRTSKETLGKVSHKVYAAQVTVGVIGSIIAAVGGGGLWLFWHIWQVVFPLIQLKPHH
ncbi:MAG: hypothetical protein ACYDFU_01335 [Nitrospirota bacterium]